VTAITHSAGVDVLRAGAFELLPRTYDEERGLCSFKAELVDGRLVQDWTSPYAVRYTITALLGLHAAAHPRAEELTLRFLEKNRVDNRADIGLLTLLHCERGAYDDAERELRRAEAAAEAQLEMQELAWLLWGACAAAHAGLDGGEAVADALLRRAAAHYVAQTGLARHSLRRRRRSIVSFGSLVYYLRAMHEASTLGRSDADRLFRAGLERVLAFQGPLGEWPWMFDVDRGLPFDRYPVFSVHQDSMAPLFLVPAVARNVEYAAGALERSVAWVHGRNELGLRFYVDDPFFFAYRAIERAERFPKARRYARWVARTDAAAASPGRLRVNRECRSYHLGWVLYAWS